MGFLTAISAYFIRISVQYSAGANYLPDMTMGHTRSLMTDRQTTNCSALGAFAVDHLTGRL